MCARERAYLKRERERERSVVPALCCHSDVNKHAAVELKMRRISLPHCDHVLLACCCKGRVGAVRGAVTVKHVAGRLGQLACLVGRRGGSALAQCCQTKRPG